MIIENQIKVIKSNLLHCPIEKFDGLFFSSMDYLNNLFMSNDPRDILRFYDYFDNRDQLIKWMMERPKGNYRIVEFNKENNDIIVVIPTMDVNGKLAKTCRDDIFKGLHIIFVESGIGNYYFNYAHNCNAGIKKAMEYNPKWIVLSNDDMYKIDDVEILKNELRKLDYENIDVVLPDPPKKLIIGKPTIVRTLLYFIYNNNLRNRISIEKYFKKRFKLNNYYTIIGGDGPDIILFKYLYTFLPVGYYGFLFIFSSRFLKNYSDNLFDETYINGSEDADLNFRYGMQKLSRGFIKFKIGYMMGASLGKYGSVRSIREVANSIYFNFKFEDSIENLLKIQNNVE